MDLSSLSSQAYKVIINISLFFSHLSFKISICNEIYYLLTKLSVALLALLIISADGRFLDPMIIWLASTHRANWTTHSTPRWHYAYSDSGYTDSYLSLQWLKLVFDPQTKERANQKPRVLICDGFGTHETVETLEFCLENNIIQCRIPSHTSHKLQLCDISVFGPLKLAYRDQLERLEQGCVGTVGKEHFTYLYGPAREEAFTSRKIRAGWAKGGLFPFNPERVLRDISKPPAEPTAPITDEVRIGCCTQDQVRLPRTPVTPDSAAAVASLHNLIKQDAHMLDEASKQRLHRHVEKLANATQLFFAERTLLQQRNRFLAQINNEAKVRRSTKSKNIGTARVMRYEDLEKARAEHAAKEAEKEARKAKKILRASPTAEEATVGKGKRGRKHKSRAGADVPEPKAKMAHMGQTQVEGGEIASEPWRAPVARMW